MGQTKSSKPSKTSKRLELRQKRQRNQRLAYLGWGLGAVILLGALVYFFMNANRPPLGAEYATTGANDHVAETQPLPPYSSDPPTSGTHYPTWWQAGFYDENSPEVTNFAFPAGYLVHNLEHGYVIFWYNCTLVTTEQCDTLKSDLRSVMDEANDYKVIAFPWSSTDVPVVATSWGRMLKMQTFDSELAAQMIQRNRNHAPEPNAQ